ncbi:MAG: protein translocase subunit SecF [Pseudomonadota bacterium]
MAFKGLDFLPRNTRIQFIRLRFMTFVASAFLMLASLGLFFTQGLNYGIDFVGGTVLEMRSSEAKADIPAIRERLKGLGLGDVQVQQFGDPRDVLIRVELQAAGEEGAEKAQQGVAKAVREALAGTMEERRVEVIGPTVSAELARDGLIAVLVAICGVLLYIWFRFEWQFSVGAVAALVHDVTLTIGMFALIGLEFNLSIIAALLTIVGYSLNDTVVVYDRIRENLRKFKRMPLAELLDLSINETLSRTILTSVTTLIALFALFIFGTEVIRGFTFAMIWGVVVGTYSSIFVAAPLLLFFGVTREWGDGATATTRKGAVSNA